MITAWIAAPLALLATWLVLSAVIIGVGMWFRRLLRAGDDDADDAFAAFWLGTGVVVLLSQLWHFVRPVDTLLLALIAAAGTTGLIRERRALFRAIERWRHQLRWPVAAALLLAGWWLGDRALAAGANFDTDMYHVPAVEWIRAFPLVPGLANLHGRFGFNNSNFLLAALLESGPWRDGSTYLLNGTFVLVCLLRVLGSFLPAADGAAATPARTFDMLLLAPVIGTAAHPPLLSSLSPDLPATCALFSAASLLVGAAGRPSAARATSLAAALVACILAVAFKLSMAPFAAIAAPLTLWLMRRDVPRRAAAVAGVLAVALAASWAARGVGLSGYPLYPSTVAAAPVDWRVPAEQAEAETAWIRYFALTWYSPSTYSRGRFDEDMWLEGEWLRPWARALASDPDFWQVPLPAALLAFFLLLQLGRTAQRDRTARTRPDPGAGGLAGLGAAAAVALAAWFYLAPRPQFGFGFFWVAAASAGAALPPVRAVPARLGRAVALALGLLPLGAGALADAVRNEGPAARAAFDYVFIRPDADSWLQPTRFEYPARSYTTASGLQLTVPTGHRCGRAPLPCTSHPAPNLRLRTPGRLADGFAADGAWRAERWPNPWTRFLENWRAAKGGSPTARRPPR